MDELADSVAFEGPAIDVQYKIITSVAWGVVFALWSYFFEEPLVGLGVYSPLVIFVVGTVGAAVTTLMDYVYYEQDDIKSIRFAGDTVAIKRLNGSFRSHHVCDLDFSYRSDDAIFVNGWRIDDDWDRFDQLKMYLQERHLIEAPDPQR